jgi:hypothetical protein
MVAVFFQCIVDLTWQVYVINYYDDAPNDWHTKFGLVTTIIAQCIYMATMNISMWMFAYQYHILQRKLEQAPLD